MELMLAITEYNYFKQAAGVPNERSFHNPSFDYERNKKCTSITVIAGIVGDIVVSLTEYFQSKHEVHPFGKEYIS